LAQPVTQQTFTLDLGVSLDLEAWV